MNPKGYARLNPMAPILRRLTVPVFALKYYRTFRRAIQLKDPVLFYDKIFWMSMHTDTSMWSQLADKYAVRQYVEQLCGERILTKLYGVYDHPDEIDFSTLPDQFVMKTTNGCASNVIVRDKASIDEQEVKKQMDFWMKIRYGDITGQPHYSRIVPRIIAEELLIQDNDPSKVLTDYKFNCFNGMVHSCAAFSNRKQNTHQFSRMLYDMDWNPHPEWLVADKVSLGESPRPACFDQMKDIAQRLSVGFPYVRVDLYSINDEPKFGEMTFTPGLAHHTTQFQKELGDLIKLDLAK